MRDIFAKIFTNIILQLNVIAILVINNLKIKELIKIDYF